jgi:predicted dehydrogenase
MSIDADSSVRWGFLGAGGIATTVAADLARTPGNELVAVAARDAGRAAEFAGRFGASRSYGDYAELVADDEVDVVYIATTHPRHREQALLAIEAGKPVLIEKPVCLTAADTRAVFAAAEQAGVFAMEARWMRTNPLIRQAQSLIAEGAIGEVRSVRAEMSLGHPYDPAHRLYDLANGGGALLDLGIYPVTFAWIFLGEPDSVAVTGDRAGTGADATVGVQWSYRDGRDAQLWCSAPLPGPYRGLVQGSAGWIEFHGRFYCPDAMTLGLIDGRTQTFDQGPAPAGYRPEIDRAADSRSRASDLSPAGYRPEIEEVARCLRAGLTTSPLVPPADTIAIMEQLDAVRAELGVRYPDEES